MNEIKQLTDFFPTYRIVRHFLRGLDGVRYPLFRSTWSRILKQRGTRQKPVDWSDPDAWIPGRLSGEGQALALRIWRESNRELTPRYVRGSWDLTTKHDLLTRDAQDNLRVTERGQRFFAEPEGQIVVEIDAYEGIFTLLRVVAERGPGKRGDFLPDWTAYCRTFTTWHAETLIKSSLRFRMLNLIDRGYVVRLGQAYGTTDAGLSYLKASASLMSG